MEQNQSQSFRYPGSVLFIAGFALIILVGVAVALLLAEDMLWVVLLASLPMLLVMALLSGQFLTLLSSYETDAQGITWRRRLGEEVRLQWMDLDQVKGTLTGGLRLTSRVGGPVVKIEALLEDMVGLADVLRRARPDLWGTPDVSGFSVNPLLWIMILVLLGASAAGGFTLWSVDRMSMVFFVLMAVILFYQLLRWPLRVSIGQDGLEVRTLTGVRRYAWSEIESVYLFLQRTGRNQTLVVRVQAQGKPALDLRSLNTHSLLVYNHLQAWRERQVRVSRPS